MSPNTSMEPLNNFEGSAENSIEAVSDQSVPVNFVSPPATESCHSQTTEEAAPFAIEFCCGTAGLTAQLRKCGLCQSHGVDHIIKAGAKAPICKLDLTDPASENLARSWLLHLLCKYAHFGIPCGTCSRAREIPLGPDAPRPLSSDDFPEGLEDLTAAERKRVDAANQVYAACCRLIICCIINGIRWNQMVIRTTTSVNFLVDEILEAGFAPLPANLHELPCLHAWRSKAKADNPRLRHTRVDGAQNDMRWATCPLAVGADRERICNCRRNGVSV